MQCLHDFIAERRSFLYEKRKREDHMTKQMEEEPPPLTIEMRAAFNKKTLFINRFRMY